MKDTKDVRNVATTGLQTLKKAKKETEKRNNMGTEAKKKPHNKTLTYRR